VHRTITSNTTIQRNENDAIKSEKKGENEADRPEPRVMTTVRSPSAERTGGLQGQTLPVVEEIGEASSTGGRSGVSRERDENEADRRPLTPAKDGIEMRPRTPAKDNVNTPPLTPDKDYSPNGKGNGIGIGLGSGMKRPVSRSSLDKELPPLPKVTSPEEMNEKESILP